MTASAAIPHYGSLQKFASAAHAATKPAKGGRPALPVLAGCLFVPWLIFCMVFWLKSFDLRYSQKMVSDLCCYALLIVPLSFAFMTGNLLRSGSDAKPMVLLLITTILAWVCGFFMGDGNFHLNMQPYYDIERLNTYPSVDPAKYVGQQMMDAGQIEFVPSTRLWLQKSIGFKNGDVYCVAPIVNQDAAKNGTQEVFDFWAVGVNCCSGHMPDFHCGEYTNPYARTGLRLMAEDTKPMFRLAVKQAEANFNIKSPHPVFLYWLQDPSAEVNAYQDDGWKAFVMGVFVSFAVQLFVVVFATAIFAKI